jgi:hypothetical protein
MEEKANNVTKARALLEQGRLKNQKNPQMWLLALSIERYHSGCPFDNTV